MTRDGLGLDKYAAHQLNEELEVTNFVQFFIISRVSAGVKKLLGIVVSLYCTSIENS
jgi:hypothetical protein